MQKVETIRSAHGPLHLLAVPAWTPFLRFLGPLMLSNVLQALSGTINNVYLGQSIGVHALAACTAFFPTQSFFVIGVSGGASVVIGEAFGAVEIVAGKRSLALLWRQRSLQGYLLQS
jgi:Na+-driven multidrug efflux pump